MANEPKARAAMEKKRRTKIEQRAGPDEYNDKIGQATRERIKSRITQG